MARGSQTYGWLVPIRGLDSGVQYTTGADPHYLDYFNCRLAVSPSGEWLAEDGWFWYPMGLITLWNVRTWLERNVWESEDGPSRKQPVEMRHVWDMPLCWLDDHTVAVWGLGEGDVRYAENMCLVPGVRVFDAATGEELRWFAGPEGRFFFDRYLFSCARSGTAVWDAYTGEHLHHDPRCRALRYHPGAREFLTLLPGGAFLVSRLQER